MNKVLSDCRKYFTYGYFSIHNVYSCTCNFLNNSLGIFKNKNLYNIFIMLKRVNTYSKNLGIEITLIDRIHDTYMISIINHIIKIELV